MSSDKKDHKGVLLGMCNPLLDISAEVGESMLSKYGVKMNNAILAEAKHLPIYQELIEKHDVQYIAGGATQNTIRVAQWMLQIPGATTYIGAVGKDKFAEQLRKSATADGVTVHYYEDSKEPTGSCAVLIHNKERSLIANLGAANTYKLAHLQSEAIATVWKQAQIFIVSGFFLTVSPDSILHLAKHSHDAKKTFCMSLSAPFICEFFNDPLMKCMPYCDYMFGNESEATAFGKKMGYKDTSPSAVAMEIYNLPKENSSRSRIVVITQGADKTIVVKGGKLLSFDVPKVPASEIVDVNGAGDAFLGGFLSQLALGKPLEDSIRAGHYAARVILGVSGTVLKGKPGKW
jgi:adenosine kinase